MNAEMPTDMAAWLSRQRGQMCHGGTSFRHGLFNGLKKGSTQQQQQE